MDFIDSEGRNTNELSNVINELSNFTNKLSEYTHELSEHTNELSEYSSIKIDELKAQIEKFREEEYKKEGENERRELIRRLREEAYSVKECCTKYAFRGIAFSVAILGFIASGQKENPYISLAGILVTIILLIVARIGTYKYGTANRNYGFELHLHRTKDFKAPSDKGWRQNYRYIGWEEAMRAWRIVFSTIFENMYHTKGLYKDKPIDNDISYKWYSVKSNLKDKDGDSVAVYHAGRYLDLMLKILHGMAFAGVIPIFIASIHFFLEAVKAHTAMNSIRIIAFFEFPVKFFLDILFSFKLLFGSLAKSLLPHIYYSESFTDILLSFKFSFKYLTGPTLFRNNAILSSIFLTIALFMCVYIFYRMTLNKRKSDMLKDGLLSIHSCAIVWQAVVVAHYKAKQGVFQNGYKCYSHHLGIWANKVSRDIEGIHEWVVDPNRTIEPKKANPSPKNRLSLILLQMRFGKLKN